MYYNYKPASKTTRTTFRFPKSGKYYYEWQNEESSSNPGRWQSGIINVVNETSTNYDITGYNDADIVSYSYGGSTWFGTTHTAASWDGTTRSWYSPERAAWAVDCDTGNVWVGRVASDGTTQWWAPDGSATGNPSKFLNPTGQIDKDITHHYLPFMSFHEGGAASSSAFACNINFGQHSFLGTIPDGFKTLSSANIPPDPSINTIIKPQRHFDTVLYTGNASDQKITGLEFKPDMIWFKSRTSTSTHGMADSVRGRSKLFYPDTDQAQETSDSTRDLVSFDDGGFTVGNPQRLNSTNGSGLSIVAWCWKAGGNSNTFNVDGTGYASASAAGITEGNLAITGASINREAGFSIVTFNANNSASATIGHGLNSKPKFVIVKDTANTDDWQCKFIDDNTYLTLNSTASGSTSYPDYTATDTLINLGYTWNNGSGTHVAYSWTEIPGYSKIGSYEGNQNADGTYVHLGFKPAWIIVKNADNSSNRHWCIVDTTRTTFNKSASAEVLFADDSQVESYANNNYGQFGSKPAIDILSNGFKVREGETSAYTQFNRSNTHIYMAFAEQPDATPFDTFPNAL